MSTITDELYESFKKNLESVNGSCMRTAKAGLGKLIADVFTTQEITSISVFESPMMKEAGVVATLDFPTPPLPVKIIILAIKSPLFISE